MTEGDFDGLPICGVAASKIDPLAKWPGANPDLPWHVDLSGYKGSMSADTVLSAFARAWKYWSDEVEISPRMVNSVAEAKVRIHFAREDGASGVLAWSYLADNTNSPKIQRYDNSESWNTVNPERPPSGIDLVRVACHEIGHVLGLEHDGSAADALLRPSYSAVIPGPRPRDVARLVSLGYKKRTASPAPPPPPAPVDPDPPPVNGFSMPLPGGGSVTCDYAAKVITHPKGWTARVQA